MLRLLLRAECRKEADPARRAVLYAEITACDIALGEH